MIIQTDLRTKLIYPGNYLKFCRRFKRDPEINLPEVGPLSKDITDADNSLLTRTVIDEEILQTTKIS